MPRSRIPNAFTLVELLVVMSIIAVLLAILLPALARARSAAKYVTELAGSKSLGQAYLGRALDRDGKLLVGYTTSEAGYGPGGVALSGQEAYRYPWRLAEYIDHGFNGSLLVNEQAAALGTRPVSMTASQWHYAVSTNPSFGLNYHHLGGNAANTTFNQPGMITSIDQADAPSGLIVFASARLDTLTPGVFQPGFFRIASPNDSIYAWPSSPYAYGNGSATTGNVDPRWDGRAVTAHLDGHAKSLSVDELRDMRRWSNAAARASDPDWSP